MQMKKTNRIFSDVLLVVFTHYSLEVNFNFGCRQLTVRSNTTSYAKSTADSKLMINGIKKEGMCFSSHLYVNCLTLGARCMGSVCRILLAPTSFQLRTNTKDWEVENEHRHCMMDRTTSSTRIPVSNRQCVTQ